MPFALSVQKLARAATVARFQIDAETERFNDATTDFESSGS